MLPPAELSDVAAALARPPRALAAAAEVAHPAAAVALVFTPGRRLWLIRRAERRGDPWSGHVALPGGRREPGDADLLAAAVRETAEEVGVSLPPASLLGRLDDLEARPVRRLVIRPFVFGLDHEPAFVPNREVAALLPVSLDALRDGVGRTTMRWPAGVGMRLPAVDLGEARLWGLTLRVVDDLLDRLDGGGVGLARARRR